MHHTQESHVGWTFSTSELFLQRFSKIVVVGKPKKQKAPSASLVTFLWIRGATVAVLYIFQYHFHLCVNALNTPTGLWTFSHLLFIASTVQVLWSCFKCVSRFHKPRENKKISKTRSEFSIQQWMWVGNTGRHSGQGCFEKSPLPNFRVCLKWKGGESPSRLSQCERSCTFTRARRHPRWLVLTPTASQPTETLAARRGQSQTDTAQTQIAAKLIGRYPQIFRKEGG